MSLDISKKAFDPINDFSGVLMQQGRVQLDSDWNELIDILDRRLRAGTMDIIGRAVVPKETPDGFKIGISGGKLTIGAGRMYVDGLLAENHGRLPYTFDPVLAEERSDLPVPYDEQPYLPNAADVSPQPRDGGPHLVYLDVWRRVVSHLQDPDLIEKAVAVDTTGRTQTAWQVKVLPDVGTSVTCDSDPDQIPGWEDLSRPSSGRLTTGVVGVSDDGPCVVPPTGNYRGLENQLYRVEIHDGGPQGTATFKWSRDNGSVATRVEAIRDLDKLVVENVGRDDYLRFGAGDWVEVTDDWREFAGLAGHMRQVKSVDDPTRTLTLENPLPAGLFPTDAQDSTDPDRHTRVRRWDQQGEVRDENDNLLVDLDASGSDGLIPVPAAGTHVVLENGVAVSFNFDPSVGSLNTQDYWVFAARTADASVEVLEAAPPVGIHHHFAPLALVTFPNNVTDCRVLWPPDIAGAGCDCTVCVTADSHNQGTQTIQWAIDQAKVTGGTVCLGPGSYNLGDQPIRIQGAQSLRIHGQGWRTILLYSGSGAAMIIENSIGVRVEDLTLVTSGVNRGPAADLALRNLVGVTIQRCVFVQTGREGGQASAVGLAGLLFDAHLRENVIVASQGIGNLGAGGSDLTATLAPLREGGSPLLTAELYIEDNLLFCRRRGISLTGFSLHTGETRLAGNSINGCSEAGIAALGWILPGSGLDVTGNELRATGHGIVLGVDGARVHDNDISDPDGDSSGDGIVLATGLNQDGIDHCQIVGNRVLGMAGRGISVNTIVTSVMIKQNVIEGVGAGGIEVSPSGKVANLSIENNQLLNIAPKANNRGEAVFGIFLAGADQVEIASNTIRGVGMVAVENAFRGGIRIAAANSVRIVGNEVLDIGPPQFIGYSAGIDVMGSFDRADIVDNVVRRHSKPPDKPDSSNWYALLIRSDAKVLENNKLVFTGGMLMATKNLGNSSSVVSTNPTNPIASATTEGSMFDLEHTNYVYAVNSTTAIIWTRIGALFIAEDIARLLPRGQGIMGIRGNLFEAYGRVQAAIIVGDGAFDFSGNRCILRSPGGVGLAGFGSTAVIVAGALVLMGNYFDGPTQAKAIQIRLPDQAPYSVLGNIASGPIEVNGAALADPWLPLNVSAA